MNQLPLEPVYQSFPGWDRPVADCRSMEDLPEQMNNYLNFINEYLGVHVTYVSNGPGRDQILAAS